MPYRRNLCYKKKRHFLQISSPMAPYIQATAFKFSIMHPSKIPKMNPFFLYTWQLNILKLPILAEMEHKEMNCVHPTKRPTSIIHAGSNSNLSVVDASSEYMKWTDSQLWAVTFRLTDCSDFLVNQIRIIY